MITKIEGLDIYSQPDFYRFGHDSIYLAKFASILANNLSFRNTKLQALDIGSGSGVVALECMLRLSNRANWQWHLLEFQPEFFVHLQNNIARAGLSQQISISIEDFFEWSLTINGNAFFDLIVSNPPFFISGQQSPDIRRQACRHWTEEKWKKFINQTMFLLHDNGIFIFLFVDCQLKLIEAELHNQKEKPFHHWKIFKDQSVCLGIIGKLDIQTNELLAQLQIGNIIK